MTTTRMTVGQALARFLAVQYSERDGVEQRLIPAVWAILGHGNVAGFGQALEEFGAELELPSYRPQNEQAMVHAAAAFARHNRRLATFACAASIGPGSTNMLTAAAGATVNRLPVLLLPSDHFANHAPDPVLQQLEHPAQQDVSVNDCFRPVSRFFTRISRPDQLLAALPEAMRVLTDPVETGAVVVALPEDVQAEAFDWPARFFRKRVWRVARAVPEPQLVHRAVELIERAERPLIVTGGGTIYGAASLELRALASTFEIPVVETQAGKGAIPWSHPLCAGPVGANGGSAANALARDADVVLAVGTRLGDFTTGSRTTFANPDVRFVGLNVVPFDAGKLDGLPLVADAQRGLRALHAGLTASGWAGTAEPYREQVAALKLAWDQTVDGLRAIADPAAPLSQAQLLGMLNDEFGGGATVINAAGTMPGDLLKLWRTTAPLAYHVEYGYSCMGYEIPAGIGVRMADGERDVLVLVGDGSYLMMNSEIVTAVAEGMRMTIVVVDNHGFQSIHGLQRACGTPTFLTELRHRDATSGRLDGEPVAVDYAGHAEAMGADAYLATNAAQLKRALDRTRANRGVSLIHVRLDAEPRVPGFDGWWDVPVAEVGGQPSVRQARADYEQAVRRRRRG